MTDLKTALLGAAATLALAAATPALAQDVADATEVEGLVVVGGSQVDLPDVYAGEQVARGSRVGLFGALDVMDTPFATTSYTQALIQDQQARSVADVLQNDPGVRLAKGFGNFQEVYVIRGFPVFSDDMTYNGVYGVLPRQYVAAELLERVEIFRGANAFVNGAAPGGSSVGGAVNLVPKRAPNAPLTTLTAGWETGGQLYAAADLARRFGGQNEYGVRLNVVKRDGETSIEAQERDLTLIALGVDRQGDRFRFSADLGYQDHRIDAPRPAATPTGAVPAAPSADVNFAQPWTYTDERQLFGAARAEFDITPALSAWAAVGARDGEEQNVLANPNVSPTGDLTAYRFDNRREDQVVSADVGLRYELQTGPVGHRLIASASVVELESRNAYAFSSFITTFSSGTLSRPAAATQPAADFFIGGSLSDPLVTERVKNSSFALADLVTLFDGAVIATIGARYQEIDTRSYDYNTGVLGSSYKSDAVTPALGLVYKYSDQISFYANYAEALTPGQIAPASSGGVPIVNVGEVLEPFRSKQYEAGLKYDGGGVGGSLSVFSISQPSAVVENARFTANGEQEHRGVEFSVFGEPAEGVRLLGGLTLIETEIENAASPALRGKEAIGVPEVMANLNLEWDVPALEGLTLDGRIVHTGEQFADAANTQTLDAWARLDLGARYTLDLSDMPVTLRARVENVTGEEYWASVGGYPGANYLVLGSPRTFTVSASVDF
jgi:iron complex outermembrane receptor protein